jgi:hypothetical protein
MAGIDELVWWKSGRCDSGACVEVAIGAGQVFVRDSADPDGPWLSSSRARWGEFVEWLKRQDTSAS